MTSYRNGPDAKGLFGHFGGQYVAETLMPLIHELAAEYEKPRPTPSSPRSSPTSSATTWAAPRRCTSPSA